MVFPDGLKGPAFALASITSLLVPNSPVSKMAGLDIPAAEASELIKQRGVEVHKQIGATEIYISSWGAGTLTRYGAEIKEKSGRVVLSLPYNTGKKSFDLSGFDKVTVYDIETQPGVMTCLMQVVDSNNKTTTEYIRAIRFLFINGDTYSTEVASEGIGRYCR